jgi:hypothetical protein
MTIDSNDSCRFGGLIRIEIRSELLFHLRSSIAQQLHHRRLELQIERGKVALELQARTRISLFSQLFPMCLSRACPGKILSTFMV